MKDILTVMKFTILDMVKKKSFIISTLVMLIMIVVGCNVPNIINLIKGDNGDDKTRILVVDQQNVFENQLDKLNNEDYEIIIDSKSFDEIKKQIEDNKIDAGLIIEKETNDITVRYIIENTLVGEIPEDLINNINVLYSSVQIQKMNLTTEQLEILNTNFDFQLELTEEVGGDILATMFMSIVLFFGVFFCAFQVSSSITTEKTSKIMETLVTSTSPRTIVLGKTIGIGLVGLGQMVLIISTVLISAYLFVDRELLSSIVDLSNITPFLAIVMIIYFILGYFVYSLLFALVGSTVSKPEDVQTANQPVSFIAVIGFYLSYFTMMNPTSNLNLFAALLPISSPFCMPFRVMMGLASPGEIIISLLLLAISILIVAKIAIRIYSNAILNYGTKLSIKDMIKIYKER